MEASHVRSITFKAMPTIVDNYDARCNMHVLPVCLMSESIISPKILSYLSLTFSLTFHFIKI